MFEKMRRIILLALSVSGFAGQAAAQPAPAPAPKCEYEYKPFPRLRATAVQEDHFVQRLRDSCKALEQAPELELNLVCSADGKALVESQRSASAEASTLVGTAPNTLAGQMKVARHLPDAPLPRKVSDDEPANPGKVDVKPKAKKAVDKPKGTAEAAVATAPQECANAQASTAKVVEYVEALKSVCGKLHRAAPESIDDKDLGVLRVARETPEILETIRLWAKGKFGGLPGLQEALLGSAGKGASGASPLGPGLGTLSDQLIRGMAEFLAKRAQDEALRYLRERLKTTLCGDQGANADLRKAAFRYTCQAIETMDDSMSLQAVGSAMRAAAEKDLRKLPDLGLDYVEFAHPSKANLTFAARLGLAYFSATRGGQEPFGLLASLGELEFQACESTNCLQVSKAARFASAVAYALRQGGPQWYAQYDEGFPAEDRPVVGVAVLLLTEQRLGSLGAPRNIGWKLTEAIVNRVIVQTFNVVTSAGDVIKTWEALELTLKRELSEQERREVLAEGLRVSADKVAHLFETLGQFGNDQDLATIRQALVYWTDFVDVAASLVRRDYAAAVATTISSLGTVAEKDGVTGEGAKYLPLLVEIASAQSSNDVAAAFDAAAAPLGTYKIKYQRPVIAINGFLGLQGGFEYMNTKGVHGTTWMLAPFAPIGVHASFPVSNSFHFGGLVSLIDVGALATLRGDSTPSGNLDGSADSSKLDVKQSSQVGFTQVFSPGAYLVLGLGGSPFVAGAGVSLSPQLRKVTQGALETEATVLRIGAFLSVDVPIFPLN